MHAYNKEEVVPRLHANLAVTVQVFGTFLDLDEKAVPLFLRNQACLRRFSLSFLALFEYLREVSSLPADYLEKQPEELAAYFVKQGYLDEGDTESFVLLASIYVAVRWASHGKNPDEEKIMAKARQVYELLIKVVDSGKARLNQTAAL